MFISELTFFFLLIGMMNRIRRILPNMKNSNIGKYMFLGSRNETDKKVSASEKLKMISFQQNNSPHLCTVNEYTLKRLFSFILAVFVHR